MTPRNPHVALDESALLREVFARLRAAGGSSLAEGQTACCYVLSKNHPLLRAIERLLEFTIRD